ncbi:hypothetical protein D4R75_02440 [bacterium]|nr:MAG: hypothetical protein D4R75_02440 [bacterium]
MNLPYAEKDGGPLSGSEKCIPTARIRMISESTMGWTHAPGTEKEDSRIALEVELRRQRRQWRHSSSDR